MAEPVEVTIRVDVDTSVSGLWQRPRAARAVLAFAHGAGAGMTHPFMVSLAKELAGRGVGTLRYQFPYMEAGRRRIDSTRRLTATVRAAVAEARRRARGLPLLAGGKSMGGRMTTLAASEEALGGVLGIALVGFPLHPAGRPSLERAEHLPAAAGRHRLLFVQGTRDPLGDPDVLAAALRPLSGQAVIHVVDGADHSFHVLKRSGRTDAEAMSEVAGAIASFAEHLAVAAVADE